MNIKFLNCENFLQGINALQEDMSFKISNEADYSISFAESDEDILKVSVSGSDAEISCNQKARFFRGLSYALKAFSEKNTDFSVCEHPRLATHGPMFDTSRNSVLNVKTVKKLIDKTALMGLNMFMLYTEDTYEVKEYPYFGHMRGRYTAAEIKEIDDYAIAFGIELIPCIQCLSHLGTGLQWSFTSGIKDVYDTLLIGEEKTYEFIETLIRNVAEMFTSKRVHVGLDEAFFVGCGEYIEKNNKHEQKIKLISYHINRVYEICQKYNLKPMMWSDMLLGGGDIENAGEDGVSAETVKGVPDGMQQISWAYTLVDIDRYRDFIAKQKDFPNLAFCGAVFTYLSYFPSYKQTIQNLTGIQAALEAGIKDVIISIWNNEAACPLVTSLYGMQLYAEFDYTGKWPGKNADDLFEFICKVSVKDICTLEKADDPAEVDAISNASRFMMFNDPLVGLIDKHIEGVDTRKYYSSLYKSSRAERGSCDELFAPVFEFFDAVVYALELKADFGVRLKKAYDSADSDSLHTLYDESFEMEKRIKALRDVHFRMWMYYNKASGFEIYDMYYGAIISRCSSVRYHLERWFEDNSYIIEELAEDRLYLWNSGPGVHPLAYNSFYRFGRYYTANVFAIRYKAHLFG
ncbi:MAG: family 20 glycosylhydrolase [Clostridia bacterium]|nr:family 20 glycosylhydrolase [Clostridia bacterium]